MKAKLGAWVLVALLALALIYWAAQSVMERRFEREVQAFVADLPPEWQVEYEDVSVSLWRRDATIHRLHVRALSQPVFTAERLDFVSFDRRNTPPRYLHARLLGVEQDLSELHNEQAELLQSLGYDRLLGDYEFEYRYREDEQRLDIRELSAHLRDIGRMSASLRLDGVDLTDLVLMPQEQMFFVSIVDFSLSYRDESFLSKVIAQVATEQGLSEEAVIQGFLLRLDAEFGHPDEPFYQEFQAQLGAFLQEPNTLTLRAQPEQPVSVIDAVAYGMVRPGELPQLLNLSIEAD
ncbi:hypothetical protein CAI21_15835 [Alkalilimnicola ehrlichii]|uniref:DUF945 domain-containing protein n=1 Tax=Alkalilimnicola ehrlichii TaxID=351052 RepID=A0A3E0WME0_9GAMM|nr:hypothetical protein [Alkalilimnicola ehrlichii]RFA27020.1 hypothetical protein CAI21_15835 [Alkalilimnicola ehrlichii]RFA34140.1 hypothetical protein CAL65_15965 [Alkalilimnicola ehrlichii]